MYQRVSKSAAICAFWEIVLLVDLSGFEPTTILILFKPIRRKSTIVLFPSGSEHFKTYSSRSVVFILNSNLLVFILFLRVRSIEWSIANMTTIFNMSHTFFYNARILAIPSRPCQAIGWAAPANSRQSFNRINIIWIFLFKSYSGGSV